MVTTTSAARTFSSVHRFGCAPEMSMPTSAIASTAAGFTCSAGSEPPEYATARSPASLVNHPRAICDRPALWTHRNSTLGGSSGSGIEGLLERGLGFGEQDPGGSDGEAGTEELGGDEAGGGGGADAGEGVRQSASDGGRRVRHRR